MRSFLRMAGISQRVSPDEVLPLLARNVYVHGYRDLEDNGDKTEFLSLVGRYMDQAMELSSLAGPDGIIHVSNCEQAKPLLLILGYRVQRGICGTADTSLETSNADRAFLTVDSGFPLHDLELSLQTGKPFSFAFPASRVPILGDENDWIDSSVRKKRERSDLISTFEHNPRLARLYWALSRMDPETSAALLRFPGAKKLVPYAAVLDFYGSQICIRSGRVVVPGGEPAEPAWKVLVGADPKTPIEFILRLIVKDGGWLAAYFDALSRASREQQARFVESNRLQRFYAALRTPGASVDPARGVLRPAPGLLLLATRLNWTPEGQAYVPGGLDVWKEIFHPRSKSKAVREWGKRARSWNTPDDLVAGLFAVSRIDPSRGPLQLYLLLSELDAKRPAGHAVSPETVRLLAKKFPQFGAQYLIFSEFPELDDASIASFIAVADDLDRISDQTLRGNALGIFQAEIGLWQIFTRQHQIGTGQLNTSWQASVKPFAGVASPALLFDAGRNSLTELVRAVTGSSEISQDKIVQLLAGPRQEAADGERVHGELAGRIQLVLDSQRLVPLDTLVALDSSLREIASGKQPDEQFSILAGELRKFEMPRPIFRRSERNDWAMGIYNNRHTELQMRTDLMKTIRESSAPQRIAQARGELAPFLRDVLVGLNYAYYEPPDAKMLRHNPLFVRSHDFAGETVMGIERNWQIPELFGEGSPAGGGAHLVGSLADLPYVLAEVEQDFIAPENIQALIWRDLVPGLLASSVLPRWWGVSRNTLHTVALYQRAGEELLASAASDSALRDKVVGILSERMLPQGLKSVEQGLSRGQSEQVMAELTPSDTFFLTLEFHERYPGESSHWRTAGQELENLWKQHPEEAGWQTLSQNFGVPRPILAQSYARQLLNLQPFPAVQGYSSRLLAESWDSSNLYWARLADDLGYSPVMLNRMVPELTRRMVAKIIATDLDDWPAILRAMRETGEEFKQGKNTTTASARTAPEP